MADWNGADQRRRDKQAARRQYLALQMPMQKKFAIALFCLCALIVVLVSAYRLLDDEPFMPLLLLVLLVPVAVLLIVWASSHLLPAGAASPQRVKTQVGYLVWGVHNLSVPDAGTLDELMARMGLGANGPGQAPLRVLHMKDKRAFGFYPAPYFEERLAAWGRNEKGEPMVEGIAAAEHVFTVEDAAMREKAAALCVHTLERGGTPIEYSGLCTLRFSRMGKLGEVMLDVAPA